MCKTWVKAMEKLCSTCVESSTETIKHLVSLSQVLISLGFHHKLSATNSQPFQQLKFSNLLCYFTTFTHYPHSLLLTMTK